MVGMILFLLTMIFAVVMGLLLMEGEESRKVYWEEKGWEDE